MVFEELEERLDRVLRKRELGPSEYLAVLEQNPGQAVSNSDEKEGDAGPWGSGVRCSACSTVRGCAALVLRHH